MYAQRARLAILCLCLALLPAACTVPAPTTVPSLLPVATPSLTPAETSTPSPTATAQLVPTPTPSPTATATPAPSPSPAPVPSLAPALVALLGAQPTLLYRQAEALFAWDEGHGRGWRLLDLSHRAGDLALSPVGHLAYTLDGIPYVVDLSTGVVHPIYEAQDRPDPDWDLFWSGDGQALAYALAWDEPSGSRMVELGTYDEDGRRTVTVLTARLRAAVTPPAKPPAPAQQGFSLLSVLGFDRIAGRILAAPAGGEERHSAIWAFDIGTGDQTTLLTFDDPEAVEGLAVSPDLAFLAVRLTPARIVVTNLAAPQAALRSFVAPAGTHPGPMHWSPDGRWLTFLLCEGQAPGLAETPARALWVLDTATMQAHQGMPLPSRPPPSTNSAVVTGWHPEGKALLIRWHGGTPRRRHFQLVDADSWQATEWDLGEGARPIGWVQLPDTVP